MAILADLQLGVKHDYSDVMTEDTEQAEQPETSESNNTVQAEKRVPAKSGEDVISREILARARSAHERLRTLLSGRILITLRDLNRSFLFNWSNAQAAVSEVSNDNAKEMIAQTKASANQNAATEESAPVSSKETIDCYLTLSDRDVFRIYRGDLNPQIAMLSDKIEVGGKLSYAVYFFNLIAPRTN